MVPYKDDNSGDNEACSLNAVYGGSNHRSAVWNGGNNSGNNEACVHNAGGGDSNHMSAVWNSGNNSGNEVCGRNDGAGGSTTGVPYGTAARTVAI